MSLAYLPESKSIEFCDLGVANFFLHLIYYHFFFMKLIGSRDTGIWKNVFVYVLFCLRNNTTR
jgi:hypothetical protein